MVKILELIIVNECLWYFPYFSAGPHDYDTRNFFEDADRPMSNIKSPPSDFLQFQFVVTWWMVCLPSVFNFYSSSFFKS